MNDIKELLQKIRVALHPFYQTAVDWCKEAHQKHLEKQTEKKKTNREIQIADNLKKLRKELFEVFSTSNYPKLIQVKTLNNVRPASYDIQNNIVLYYYTIDKEQDGKIALTICNAIRDGMNNDILTYSEYLMENHFPEELMVMYPNLWYGTKVLSVVDCETNVKLTVVSNMPL